MYTSLATFIFTKNKRSNGNENITLAQRGGGGVERKVPVAWYYLLNKLVDVLHEETPIVINQQVQVDPLPSYTHTHKHVLLQN
jgi:hypothetical protein